MATAVEVLEMLLPNGGWNVSGDEYEGILFVTCEPINKAQFEAGFAKYDSWKTKENTKKALAKASAQAKLAALGLTEEEVASILG